MTNTLYSCFKWSLKTKTLKLARQVLLYIKLVNLNIFYQFSSRLSTKNIFSRKARLKSNPIKHAYYMVLAMFPEGSLNLNLKTNTYQLHTPA